MLLDTHVVVWMYQDPERLLPPAVRKRLNDEMLALSPFVRLELQYLYEVGRVTVPAQTIVDDLAPKLELALTNPPAALISQAAMSLTWTRDPFDRLISAQALATGATLATKDRTITENLSCAWWPNETASNSLG